MSAPDIKAGLRERMKRRREELSAGEREFFSCKLAENVLSWDIYQRAGRVMIYYPTAGEMSLLGLVKEGRDKTFFLPKTGEGFVLTAGEYKAGELVLGRYGIWEPKEAFPGAEIDLVLAPALACDRLGARLGQGGGYYDRFLRQLRERDEKTVFAAAVYDFQLLDSLPAEPHDMRMDYVAAPSGIFAVFKGQG